MDISTNIIDLMYLTNSKTFNPNATIQSKALYTDSDLKLYKRQIFEQTRDILTGKDVDKQIKSAFDEYVKLSIDRSCLPETHKHLKAR